MIRRLSRTFIVGGALLLATAPAIAQGAPGSVSNRTGVPSSTAAQATQEKVPVAEGFGGAVATVDLDATKTGIEVLRQGGNAIDAAVATSATLGVTEPFVAALGAGGFFTYYDARTRKVHTIDGRETALGSTTDQLFINPATGQPLSFAEARVSGLSVGVPGVPATWKTVLDKWGTWSLSRALRPAIRVAGKGFTVDDEFRNQINTNLDIFKDFPATSSLYLPGGDLPVKGSTFRNPDLARSYELIARKGIRAFYDGPIGADLVDTVQHPKVRPGATRVVRPGAMTAADLRAYRTIEREPTKVSYRGLDVYGMAPPSSGGTTVGEALNILESFDLSAKDRVGAFHNYLEASALSFADRNRYVGDPDAVSVPTRELLSQGFADERACQIKQDSVLPKPVDPGVPDGSYGGCATVATTQGEQRDGKSTTHLTISDRWGNVVAWTLTIEQFGGNGMVVPGRGFMLNNELTDFNFAPTQGSAPDPNLPGKFKRPRSSMSPTIVLSHGRPVLAVGSPGGATIITTALQILMQRIDLGMSLPDALAAPRASSRNLALEGEPAFLASPEGQALVAKGHKFTTNPAIGAATGIELKRYGIAQAVAEPVRRGGGSAMVVWPIR